MKAKSRKAAEEAEQRRQTYEEREARKEKQEDDRIKRRIYRELRQRTDERRSGCARLKV